MILVTTMLKRSNVWSYFSQKQHNSPVANCKKCGKTISCRGSTTSALINHLKSNDICINKKENDADCLIENENKKNKIEKPNTMLNFVKIKKESLEEILSRVAAVDGMSIYAITKSKAIKGYIESKGYKMPLSPTTVTKNIIGYYEKKKIELQNTFQNLKKDNRSFSITVDEWTDCVISRYLNVTVHVLAMDN